MNEVLLDTDVLIDHMRGRRHLEVGTHMSVSVITRTELYAGHEREEPAVKALLARIKELDVNPAIARRAGRIKRDAAAEDRRRPDRGYRTGASTAPADQESAPLRTRRWTHDARSARPARAPRTGWQANRRRRVATGHAELTTLSARARSRARAPARPRRSGARRRARRRAGRARPASACSGSGSTRARWGRRRG